MKKPPAGVIAVFVLIYVLTEALVAPIFVLLLLSSYSIQSDLVYTVSLLGLFLSFLLIASQFSMITDESKMPRTQTMRTLYFYMARALEPYALAYALFLLSRDHSYAFELANILTFSFAGRMLGHEYAFMASPYYLPRDQRNPKSIRRYYIKHAIPTFLFLFIPCILPIVTIISFSLRTQSSILLSGASIVYLFVLVKKSAEYGRTLSPEDFFTFYESNRSPQK